MEVEEEMPDKQDSLVHLEIIGQRVKTSSLTSVPSLQDCWLTNLKNL
jgi:hypothetical protein